MDKTNKLLLPVAILIASIILGGFFYASQVNKQRSIEKQLEIKLQEDRRIEEVKAEQNKKEYIAKRRNECYNIYLQEKKDWNNVSSFEYSELRDICIVRYKSSEPAKTGEECGEITKNIWDVEDEVLKEMIWNRYINCLYNTFSKEF